LAARLVGVTPGTAAGLASGRAQNVLPPLGRYQRLFLPLKPSISAVNWPIRFACAFADSTSGASGWSLCKVAVLAHGHQRSSAIPHQPRNPFA